MRRIFAPHLNREVALGRRRPAAGHPKLHMSKYMGTGLPTPPTSVDYSAKGGSAMTQMFLNDSLGDCVIASMYHILAMLSGNAVGTPFVATSKQIISDYSAIGGYIQGNPNTDNGCDEQTAFSYWQRHGYADGKKLIAALSIDATNRQQVELALYLFENLFFGVELPDSWISPVFPSKNGFVWDVSSAGVDPMNGHAFCGVGYNTNGVQIDTWGLIGTMTWAAIAAYASIAGQGELYVLLTPEQVAAAKAKAPNGFDWSVLEADFNALGGNVPLPPPPPAPPQPQPPAPQPTPPSPTPAPVTLTLDQVKALLDATWPKSK